MLAQSHPFEHLLSRLVPPEFQQALIYIDFIKSRVEDWC